MKTVTVRDLRFEFQKIEAMLAEGEELEITKRGRPIAHLVPCADRLIGKVKMPDFAKRLKDVFGDKRLPGNIILQERESYQW